MLENQDLEGDFALVNMLGRPSISPSYEGFFKCCAFKIDPKCCNC